MSKCEPTNVLLALTPDFSHRALTSASLFLLMTKEVWVPYWLGLLCVSPTTYPPWWPTFTNSPKVPSPFWILSIQISGGGPQTYKIYLYFIVQLYTPVCALHLLVMWQQPCSIHLSKRSILFSLLTHSGRKSSSKLHCYRSRKKTNNIMKTPAVNKSSHHPEIFRCFFLSHHEPVWECDKEDKLFLLPYRRFWLLRGWNKTFCPCFSSWMNLLL